MSRRRTIITYVIFILCLAGFMVGGIILWNQKHDSIKCTAVNIHIDKASPYHFVSDSTIRQWIVEDSIKVIGVNTTELPTLQIEENIKTRIYIDTVQVNSGIDGTLNIYVSQSLPLYRFMGDQGYDFYVDSVMKILPMQPHFKAPVPILSGNVSFNFPTNYYGALTDKKYDADKEFLKKITNFVKFVYTDKFLRDFIAQIYINQSGEIEIVPVVGDQIIILGTVENYAEKLEKLKKFYQKSFSEGWWATAKTINLKFKDQVIISQ